MNIKTNCSPSEPMIIREQQISNLSPNLNDQVKKQLDSILSSDLFNSSRVLSNFLEFVVKETLEGNADILKEYTIAVSALGKNSDFNPQIDAIVRIHAGRLRRLLTEYYKDIGSDDPIKIEMYKGSYVPVFILADQLKVEIKDNEEKFTANETISKLLSIGVLPFRNLCSDNSLQYFVDGFGEEITHQFSRFQNISVMSHCSMIKYGLDDADPNLVDLNYLIKGSVRSTQHEIKISVGLVETNLGNEIWSKSYSYNLIREDLIKIQDEIVKDLYLLLGGEYGLIFRKSIKKFINGSYTPSFNVELWNYYFHINFSKKSYFETREALENELKSNPDCASCLGLLSIIYLDVHALGWPSIEEPLKVGYKLAKKSIEVDPFCERGWLAYGWVQLFLKNKAEAKHAFEYVLEMNPASASLMATLSFGFACLGEYESAQKFMDNAKKHIVFTPWWIHLGAFFIYYKKKEYVKALEEASFITHADIFYNQLTAIAAKGQLGQEKDVQNEIKEFSKKFPVIRNNIKKYLEMILLDSDLVDHILEGLDKAGLKN